MPTALITGVLGFCGRHLANRLNQEANVRVLGVSRHEHPTANVNLDEYFKLDVCDEDQLACVVRRLKPDWVFHLAGLAGGDVSEIYRTNLLSTLYLMESLRAYVPEARVLLVGSAAEYGTVDTSELPVTEDHPCRPIAAYGRSKRAVTLAGLDYAQRHGMKVVLARPFNIIGTGIPSMLVVGALLRRAKRALHTEADPVVKVGNLDAERDFVAITDVVEGYVRMIQGEYWGEVFNICSGRPYSIRSVATLLLSHASRPIRLEVDPCLLRSSESRIIYGSWEKANRTFGFKPVTSLEDSIQAAWKYEMEGMV